MSPVQTFPSAADAMATVRAGLRFLAAADATQMPVQTQAEGEISESFARTVCLWTDKLPEDSRDTADRILVGAATAGMDLRGLAELAGEMDARSRLGLIKHLTLRGCPSMPWRKTSPMSHNISQKRRRKPTDAEAWHLSG